jgi:hypothetical protein
MDVGVWLRSHGLSRYEGESGSPGKRAWARRIVAYFIMTTSTCLCLVTTPAGPIVASRAAACVPIVPESNSALSSAAGGLAPEPGWSDQEKWVWSQALAGEAADFDRLYNAGPNAPGGGDQAWDDPGRPRLISACFLMDILQKPRLAAAIPTRGLRIIGAQIDSDVDLDGVAFDRPISLEHSRLEGGLSLKSAKIGGPVSLNGSTLTRQLTMTDANVAHGVYLMHGKFHGGINLFHATVGEMLDLTGSELDDDLHLDAGPSGELPIVLNLEAASISSNLYLSDYALFRGRVYAPFMSVGGVMQANKSRFEGEVDLEGAEIAHNLLLRWSARFEKEVNLSNARIGGELDLSGATFEFVQADNTRARSIRISGTSMKGINLAGASVETYLGLFPCRKKDFCGPQNKPLNDWDYMNLRSAQVGVIEDVPEGDNWPGRLSLDGFTYQHLGTFGTGRESNWYVKWLSRDHDFSPQPYQQLAKAFRDIGAYSNANDVLYAGRERERAEATPLRSFGLWLLKWTIGYGIGLYYFFVLFWVFGVALLGTLVLASSGPGARERGLGWCFATSLDQVLPLVELNKEHNAFVSERLTGWREFYFYLHRVAGYVVSIPRQSRGL